MATVLMAHMIIGGYFKSCENLWWPPQFSRVEDARLKSGFQRLNLKATKVEPKSTKVEPFMYKIIISIDFYGFCI